MIDTFVAVVERYFEQTGDVSCDSTLVAKTYDLKSAYRQIPMWPDHLKFAYFCIYNHGLQRAEIYRSQTLPFGATHIVFILGSNVSGFVERLSKMRLSQVINFFCIRF